MYSYWGFGLNIKSEIEFPEFFPVEFDTPDVSISTGIVPTELSGGDVVKKVHLSMTPTEYLHHMPDVARYYVTGGKEIIIEKYPEADEKSVRLFLLSNAMAAILHQRGTIPLHASAVFYDGGVALFCGHSGAGKSTTVTALQQKGYAVFSDDVCVLQYGEDGSLVVLPSYPMIKLWADSFGKIGLDAAGEGEKIRPELAKYARFFHDDFDIKPQKVKTVFILHANAPVETVSIQKLGSIMGFKLLQQNTYRYVQMNGMKKRDIHFKMISKLAAEVPVYKIARPVHDNTIEEVLKLIENNLAGNE